VRLPAAVTYKLTAHGRDEASQQANAVPASLGTWEMGLSDGEMSTSGIGGKRSKIDGEIILID